MNPFRMLKRMLVEKEEAHFAYQEKHFREADSIEAIKNSIYPDDLFQALDMLPGPVVGGTRVYEISELKERIEAVLRGELGIDNITRTHDIRGAVERLLTYDKYPPLRPYRPEVNYVVGHTGEDVAESTPAEATPQKTESETISSENIIKDYLSYQDADLPDEVKESMLNQNFEFASASRYGEALSLAISTYSIEKINTIAQHILSDMLIEAHRLGIKVSPYGKSITWAMWDLAKQYYFYLNPDKGEDGYVIGNPFDNSDKQAEIISRHLGWEAYNRLSSNPNEYNISPSVLNEKVLAILNEPPKANGTLSSKRLSELGELLRST